MDLNTIICSCNDVSYGDIKKAIAEGAFTLEAIQDSTGAGTCCGGCIPDIEDILTEPVAKLSEGTTCCECSCK